MTKVECFSVKRGVDPVWVEVAGITSDQVKLAHEYLDDLIASENQVSDAVAKAFVHVAELCPNANPSDLWQHIIYRHLLAQGWTDNTWKRVSGFALERALARFYEPRLKPRDLRMRLVSTEEANALLDKLGIAGIQSSKIDLFLEGRKAGEWLVFGAAHVKSSIAERIQDDVPASVAFQAKGLLSIALTMDSKSYPPPHGSCINYGELGGRSSDVDKVRIKRNYVEVNGQFDGLFSYNLRTPPSPKKTPSGKYIYTLSMNEKQPDQLVRFLIDGWGNHTKVKTP